MGKGGNLGESRTHDRDTAYEWEEIRKHTSEDSTWIVLENNVYDVTNFKKRHPGGFQIMEDHAGQDASVPFQLYHMNQAKVRKFMKPFQIGKLATATWPDERRMAIEEDFQKLRKKATEMGLFKTNPLVHLALFSQNVFFFGLAYWIIANYGTGWVPFLIASFMLGTCYTQAGYNMHDYGHRAVTHSPTIDHFIQVFLFNFLSLLSCSFWNEYHSRHHSKPNLYEKDPTAEVKFFAIGDEAAKKQAAEDKKNGKPAMPFNQQHKYWFLLGPPLYISFRFQLASLLYPWRKNKKGDLVAIGAGFVFMLWLYLPHMSILSFILYFSIARQVMSQWFVWISLSNHLALHPTRDSAAGMTWFEYQLEGTINLPFGYFHDWYCGGLNLQIEHHLFPYTPRENLRHLVPLVKEMCKKHNIEYKEFDTLYEAFYQVFDMLRTSGQTWHKHYYEALVGM